jgi:hypothetical protein
MSADCATRSRGDRRRPHWRGRSFWTFRQRGRFAYEAEQNEWIRVDRIAPLVIERFRMVRDGVLSAKSRIGGRLPHLGREDLQEIEAVLREIIEPMSKNKLEVSGGGADLIEP